VPSIPFEIEHVFSLTGRGVVVLARWLGPESFTSLHGATLGGVSIEPWTEIPRAHHPDGRLRLDLFAFLLSRAEDRDRFAPGARVLLEASAEQ
jgi:hypothetical protein